MENGEEEMGAYETVVGSIGLKPLGFASEILFEKMLKIIYLCCENIRNEKSRNQ